jgi:RNA polymerase sigma factor (sigma-70 family)
MDNDIASMLQSAVDGSESSREWLELFIYNKIKAISRCNLFYHGLNTEREDAVNTAWISCRTWWRKVEEVDKFNAYAGAYALNALKKELKKRRKYGRMYILTDEDLDVGLNSDAQVEHELKKGLVRCVLETLDDRDREIIRRRFWQQQRLIEIAYELGISSSSTVHHRLHCAYQSMRPALEQIMTKEEWLYG